MLLHKNYNHQKNVSLPDLEQNTKQITIWVNMQTSIMNKQLYSEAMTILLKTSFKINWEDE